MVCPICGNEIEGDPVTCPFCLSPLDTVSRKKNRRFVQKTFNLEDGRPTVEMAIGRLNEIIDDAIRNRISLLTLIHGYGSSGKGGLIRIEVRKTLDYLKAKNVIYEFVPGEIFNKRNGIVKNLLQRYPQLAANPHFNRSNKGVTIVAFLP
jgi:hypothetical protein